MKKSRSAPSLTDLAISNSCINSGLIIPKVASQPTLSKLACKAYHYHIPHIQQPIPENIFQIEAMINSPITQHFQCALQNPQKFPEVLLENTDNKNDIKDIAYCEAEPTDRDKDNESRRLNTVNRSRFYLQRSETDTEVMERYAAHLVRQRKLKSK